MQLDKEEVELLKRGGNRKSLYLEQWLRNKFNAWQKVSGISCNMEIEEMYETALAELNDLFSTFFLQVLRRDGKIYLGETLVGLLRALGRIIRGHCERKSIETSEKTKKFYILDDPHFIKACTSCLVSIQRSAKAGIGRKRKSTIGLTPDQIHAILAQDFMSRSDRRGCQMRLAFFVVHNFCVHAQQELYNLSVSDFEISSDAFGKFVRFDERSSKNHKVDLQHCQPEKLCQSVTCYHVDVVATFETYFVHQPKWSPEEIEKGILPLFHRAIDEIVRDPGVVSALQKISFRLILMNAVSICGFFVFGMCGFFLFDICSSFVFSLCQSVPDRLQLLID